MDGKMTSPITVKGLVKPFPLKRVMHGIVEYRQVISVSLKGIMLERPQAREKHDPTKQDEQKDAVAVEKLKRSLHSESFLNDALFNSLSRRET
jgi:hypothetical protein